MLAAEFTRGYHDLDSRDPVAAVAYVRASSSTEVVVALAEGHRRHLEKRRYNRNLSGRCFKLNLCSSYLVTGQGLSERTERRSWWCKEVEVSGGGRKVYVRLV